MRCGLALFAISWTWLVCRPAPAHAEPETAATGDPRPAAPRLTFGWNAAAGCPARDAVLARAERLLGRPLEASLTAPLTIDATATELGADTWELRLASGNADAAPRRVTAASCAELAEMAALFTALSIDPTLHVDESSADMGFPVQEEIGHEGPAPGVAALPAAPLPASARPPEAALGSPASPSRPASPHARHLARPLVAASAALALGRLPGLALGVGAEGGVALDRLSLRALLGYFPERHAAVTPTAGGDLTLATTGARAVYALSEGTVTVALSAGVTLGWMHGAGTGVANPGSGDVLIVALEPGARAGYALSSSLSLVADAALAVPLNRPRFVLEGREAYRPAAAGARFGLGAEWCLP